MRINKIELLSIPSNYGNGANDGCYYPVGLLSVASQLKRYYNELDISLIDLHHTDNYEPSGNIVGISASSTLNYSNVLEIAKRAKSEQATVVLGGPHASSLAHQILNKRKGIIDYIIRGYGEVPFIKLISALRDGESLRHVPNLTWIDNDGRIVHNKEMAFSWNYENKLPFNFQLIDGGIQQYWNCFRRNIEKNIDNAFVLFTHFGCAYREIRKRKVILYDTRSLWCSYCSLNNPLFVRKGQHIIREVENLIDSNNIPEGSTILLKCYGDNIGKHKEMLIGLESAIKNSKKWKKYNIKWTFYSQSNLITKDLIRILKTVGTENLYIGFDSADDRIQYLNGMGTSLKNHKMAVRLCMQEGIKIQAGFVMGCMGESDQSIQKTIQFAEQLVELNVLERINSAVLFIIPGSPAYNNLIERENWIKNLDELPTEKIQKLWLKHFCSELDKSKEKSLLKLHLAAQYLRDLSPGPKANMGFKYGGIV